MINYDSVYSVVLPCYNAESTILYTLNSIKQQTILPFEIIIIDDFSTDKSIDIILNFKNLNPNLNIKLIPLLKNEGPANARNIGLLAAKSKIIAFLDSDDEWHPHKMDIQLKVINNYDVNIVGSEVYAYGDERLSANKHKYETIPNSPLKFFKISRNVLIFSNKFFTPSVVIKVNEPILFTKNMRYCEDFDLWLRFLNTGKFGIIINYPLVKLNKSSFGESGLSKNLLKMELGELAVISANFFNFPLSSFLAMIYSVFKFFRRLFIVLLRKF